MGRLHNRVNKLVTFLLVSFFSFVSFGNYAAQKQNSSTDGIRTSLVVSRTAILPYESPSIILLLRNESPEDKRVVAAWCSFVTIGETTTDGIKWHGYHGDNETSSKPCIATPKTLAPSESEVMRNHIDFESPSGQHVFAHPGEYFLKGGTTDANSNFTSEAVKITVRRPQGIDAKAYAFLQAGDLPYFLGEYTIEKYNYNAKTVEDLEKFIASFDGSEYSYLARMGLAFMWLRGVDGKQDKVRARELFGQVANCPDAALAAAAEYHLGIVLYDPHSPLGLTQANNHLQRVVAGNAPPYYKYLAEEALRSRY